MRNPCLLPIHTRRNRLRAARGNKPRKLFPLLAAIALLCAPARAADLPDDIQHGLSLVPACLVDSFHAEGREIVVSDGPITINGIRHPYNEIGFFHTSGNIYLSHYWGYSDTLYERVVLHEFGHYLEFRTRKTAEVPKEEREFIADSFAEYILGPEDLQVNQPAVYADIQRRLEEMESRYE